VEAASGSALYRTEPVGAVADQPPFVNAVVRLVWRRSVEEIDAAALVSRLLDLERALGGARDRTVRDGPRHLDLDLLLVGERRIAVPGAIVPHPRLGGRGFVLVPLIELVGGAVRLPGDGRTLAACLEAVAAQPVVRLPYTLFS
jgi:2-amino-4-hydroxy-6-hydroxymethyldihydropteridine diphosphokinase